MAMKFDIGDFAKTLGTVSESDTPQLIYVPLEDLTADDQNFFSMREIPDLAANIELCGLQQPLRVRRSGEKFRIVSGHRRRAALEMLTKEGKLQFSSVPCIEETDEVSPAMQELRLIFANSATRRLSPVDLSEMAERVERLLYQLKEEGVEFPGRMRDQVAAACQTTGTKLAELKMIRENLQEPFAEQFKKGELKQSAAYALARLPYTVQQDLSLALGTRANPISGVAAELLLKKWESYYAFESKTFCPSTAVSCNNARGFLKATAKTQQSWQYCIGECCCDCRSRTGCPGACAEAKKLNRQDAEGKAAEEEKQKRAEEKRREAYKKSNQVAAQRLLKAVDAAGLSDDDRPGFSYAGTVGNLRKWAAGDFGTTNIFREDMAGCYGAGYVKELAQKLKCSADYILGLSDELRPAAAAETQQEGEQLYLAAWMPGGTTPAHDCTVVLEFAIAESRVSQMIGRFNASAMRFEFNHGAAVEMEPIRWIELPE